MPFRDTKKSLLIQQQDYMESGERSERQPDGLSAKGSREVSESIEASSGLKRQQCPLRRLRLRANL